MENSRPQAGAAAQSMPHHGFLAVAVLIAASLFAQNQHPVTGRKYAGVMGAGGADWLVRPGALGRGAARQSDRAARDRQGNRLWPISARATGI